MLKCISPDFSKGILTAFLSFLLCAGCTKGYDPGSTLNDKYVLLTGQPSPTGWELHGVQVNNVVDTTVKGFVKMYRPDGTFTDELGFTGYWTLYARDSLIESTRSSVNPTAPYFTNHYLIERLDKGNLQLTYMDADRKIRLIYGAKN